MEEHVQIELELSEEQLQEITGGCDQCTADRVAIGLHQQAATQMMDRADFLGTLAHGSQHSPEYRQVLQNQAAGHTNLAGTALQKAQTLLDRIAARVH